jgi:Secretion system C-terminal sorting domain
MNHIMMRYLIQCSLILFVCNSAYGQTSIESSVQSMSGGLKQGGDYLLNYTIGQPSPNGLFTGGQINLSAGFISTLEISNAVTGIGSDKVYIYSHQLFDNYPNPFNPSTTIKYAIPVENKVVLKVYDILGEEVASLIDKNQAPGYYEIKFDASNLSSGMYFYTIRSGNFVQTKKMLLMK